MGPGMRKLKKLTSEWKAVWPDKSEVERVLQFMHGHWYELVRGDMPGFQASNYESQLTSFFGQSLKDSSYEAKLLGKFSYEDSVGKANKLTGKLTDRGRNDINYFTVMDGKQLELIFEFKRLKLKPRDNRQEYYNENGMQRFVTGKYANRHHLAFMVGMIKKRSLQEDILPGLKRAIVSDHVTSELHMKKSPSGRYIQEPSQIHPELIRFDTEHSRVLLDDVPNIVLGHMFLFHEA